MKIIASKSAPNPREVQYWIDLTADKNGGVIKYNKNGKWTPLNADAAQDAEISALIKAVENLNAELNKEVSDRKSADTTVQNKIPTKVSQLTNDSKYLTAVPSQYITETELAAEISTLNATITALEERIEVLE